MSVVSSSFSRFLCLFFFFFNDPATTEIYTLSLHDALPICQPGGGEAKHRHARRFDPPPAARLHPGLRLGLPSQPGQDRKSTRLNSSHVEISYAVFCLKKKKQ